MRAFALLLTLALNAAAPPLAIQATKISQMDGGEAIPERFAFVAGETVFVTFEIAGYHKPPKSDDKQETTKMEYEITALDPAGGLIAPAKTSKIEQELAAEDKDWKPRIHHQFAVPEGAATGTYKVVITVKDGLAKKQVTAEATLPIRGRKLDPSSEIIARNFHFLRTEDEGQPMIQPIYRAGESVWARFDMTGYKYGERNRIDASYGLAVLRASGEKLFEQPEAAGDQSESFYPKRYIPGIISLNLDKTISPGEYTIVLYCRDKVGGKTTESRHVFRVE